MSSTSPNPLPGVESLTRYVDALHQQQQQVISKLTQAQQAATLPAMKAAPAPAKSVEALQAKVTDQLTGAQAIIQRASQTFGETLASGNAGMLKGVGQMTAAALQLKVKELEASQRELQAWMSAQQEYMRSLQTNIEELIQRLQGGQKTVEELLAQYQQTAFRIASNISA